jgi:hypothetical protein
MRMRRQRLVSKAMFDLESAMDKNHKVMGNVEASLHCRYSFDLLFQVLGGLVVIFLLPHHTQFPHATNLNERTKTKTICFRRLKRRGVEIMASGATKVTIHDAEMLEGRG